MEWQPIMTAPANQRILVWVPWIPRVLLGIKYEPGWKSTKHHDWAMRDSIGGNIIRPDKPPTHWMPLPEPPSAQGPDRR